MSIFRTVAKFASSPQGRRALQQAKTRLDTPENRQRLNDVVSKARSTRTPRKPAAPGNAVEPPT